MQITEVIETTHVIRETSSARLARLRELLADELKSDKPSMRYIEDLKESIKQYDFKG